MINNISELSIYKVGGCVRDQLMGLSPHDTDYVVVGATVEDMLKLGFKPVGNDFPVFLHPQTHEEYALARSEKKSGLGYKGFTFYTSPEITIEEDLSRRDLTINAIAIDSNGEYIDPFGGINDIQNKILRHVSNAFVEDPLRILRTARFRAQFNFEIATETYRLINNIVKNEELLLLSAERIWQETKKALMTNNIHKYFEVLYHCGALSQILTECSVLISNQNIYDKLKYLSQKIKKFDLSSRFALLCYLLSEEHDSVTSFINNSCLDKKSRELAKMLSLNYKQIQQLHLLSRDDIYNLVQNLDITRKKQRYQKFIELAHLLACSFNDNTTRNNLDILKKIIFKISKLNIANLIQQNTTNTVLQIRLAHYKIIDESILIFPES